jgi:hypothetical protein
MKFISQEYQKNVVPPRQEVAHPGTRRLSPTLGIEVALDCGPTHWRVAVPAPPGRGATWSNP